MLSGLLKNEIAVQVSINIMNAFVEMRKFIVNNGQIYDAYSLIVDIIKSAKKKIIIIDNYHDRFILIDGTELYHCGASLKDLGKKCFAINKIEDSKFIKFVEQII